MTIFYAVKVLGHETYRNITGKHRRLHMALQASAKLEQNIAY